MDHLTPEKRSWNMSRIRSGDTKPEKIVRSLLHRMGYRFRLRPRNLPGSPDIVLPKLKIVIFVHGCYWHRHEGCPKSTSPKTNKEFWQEKFKRNVDRDRKREKELKLQGWQVIVIWECETENRTAIEHLLKSKLSSAETRLGSKDTHS